tara:strand:+ start:111 stop:455 length:345 start_codon:yes stop_codon:yes gene_type:complete
MNHTNIQEYLNKEISESEVILFMKGTPVFPQCGFSSTVVQILSQVGIKFKSIDVLSDSEIRQGIKDLSDWPTIPQLYIKGEFVGGCDIITEMFQSGELHSFVESKGIKVESNAT